MEKFNFLLFYSTHYWHCKFYFLLIYSTLDFWNYFKRNMNFWILPIKLVSTKVKGIWTQWIHQFCTTPNCIKHNNALLSNKNYMSKSIHSTPLQINYLRGAGKLNQKGSTICSAEILFILHYFHRFGTNKCPIYGNVTLTSFLSTPNACKFRIWMHQTVRVE